jgi:hypothetical protein
MCLENEVKRYGLNANHRDLCKFRNDFDQNWHAVATSIVELVEMTAPRGQNAGEESSFDVDKCQRTYLHRYPKFSPTARASTAGREPRIQLF